MRIDQIIVGAADGDAITNMALDLRKELRRFGESDIYAEFILSEKLRGEVHFLESQAPSLMVDATVYHLSYGRPFITSHILGRREPIVVAYHNITPVHWYLPYNPEFAVGLEWGRYELDLLRDRCQLAIAISDFNAEDLREKEFQNIHVIPAGFDPFRLKTEPIDFKFAGQLKRRFPQGFVLAVGQILPHKQVELLVESVHLANSFHGLGWGLVIAGIARQEAYLRSVEELCKALPMVDVWMVGSVSDTQLASLYREGKCFLTMSGHEGLCIPPVEAMAMGLPVVARASGGLLETVGGAGILIEPNGSPAAAAEALAMVAGDAGVAQSMRAHGINRAEHFSNLNSSGLAAELIGKIFT